jgi:6-phosphofructokinase
VDIKKVGILTGGGDCPGLNSVIYGIMLKAYDVGVQCVGILKGWKGFIENKTILQIMTIFTQKEVLYYILVEQILLRE